MLLSSIIILLFLFNDVKGDKESVINEYPCDNSILIGYDNTCLLDAFKYQKQVNFLVNHTFEKWTHFESLSLVSYANMNHRHGFSNKKEVQDWITEYNQTRLTCTICDIINAATDYNYTVLFLSEFNQRDVPWSVGCYKQIQDFNDRSRFITFVLLTDKIILEELIAYFPKANIIKWSDDKEVPNNWEEQFYKGYGCNGDPPTMPTLPSTTTENPDTFYPCDKSITIAYDRTNILSPTDFKTLQDFLVDKVFKDWTDFEDLSLYSYGSYADTIYGFKNLKTHEMLESFIRNDKQIPGDPYLIDISSIINVHTTIIFVSKFNQTDLLENKANCVVYPFDNINYLTFVVLTADVQTDALIACFPHAQIIKWDIENEEVLKGWEWNFMNAYNCENKEPKQSMHPCDNKILIAFDESVETLNELQSFLLTTVFTQSWNVFSDLSLLAYSDDIRVQGFGSMHNLNDVNNFIYNIQTTTPTQKHNSPVSLCEVFYELANTYIFNINIILFVSHFHERTGEECPFWIKHIRDSVDSITFISMSKEVDTDYLHSKFPRSKIISWNTATKTPSYWDKSVYGCEDFYIDSEEYPCNQKIGIVFDSSSNYLTPNLYQKQISFLLQKVIIKQWTLFDLNLALGSYPDSVSDDSFIDSANLLQSLFFIRQSKQTKKDPLMCNVIFNSFLNGFFSIFFISIFNPEVYPRNCSMRTTVPAQFTFVSLGPLVNVTYLKDRFPNSVVVEWDLKKESEPKHWPQMLWSAFGCQDHSPIHLPTTPAPSTTKVTTLLSTSSGFKSTESLSTSVTTTSTTGLTKTTVTSTIPPSTTSSNQQDITKKVLLGVFIPVFILFIISFAIIIYWCRKKNRQNLVNVLASKNVKAFDIYREKREEDPWNISFEYLQINFLDKIGSGEFGDVYLGRINGPAPITQIYTDSPQCQRFHDCNVAVKTLPALMQIDDWSIKEFQKEIAFMKNLRFHNNIVCFLGYVNDFNNPLMLLEYCSNGDLLHYLKANKQQLIESFETNTDCKTLISFAWQISSGLEYLSSLGLIHRDVAARNVLLDAQNVCKISDFGLCRNSTNQLYLSSGGKLPVKWMAPESLKENVFSTMTDVWSYGVLLWELFTLGSLPYAEVESIITFLESGARLSKPKYCTDEIYEIMSSCWLIDPEERPTFTILCQLLAKMLETSTLHYNYTWLEEANTIEEINE